MSSDMVFFVFIFFSLAVLGAKKMFREWDKDGKVGTATQDGAVGLIGRLFSSIFRK